jgi:hypothetical protein
MRLRPSMRAGMALCASARIGGNRVEHMPWRAAGISGPWPVAGNTLLTVPPIESFSSKQPTAAAGRRATATLSTTTRRRLRQMPMPLSYRHAPAALMRATATRCVAAADERTPQQRP